MISEQTRQIFVFLVNVGLLDVVLPFAIAFALLYGLFEKTMIFGKEKSGEPRSRANLIVAMVISLMFVISLNLVNLMTKIIWVFAGLLVVVLFVLIIGGLFGVEFPQLFKKEEEQKKK